MINTHEGSSMINMHEGSTGLLLHDSRKPKTVFQIYQGGLAQEQPMPPAFIQAAIVKAVSEIYQKKFCASNSWLHGKVTRLGKRKKGFTLGWKHRYGVSFRQPTKLSPVSLKDKLARLRRHHWWLVNKMACPTPGREEECTPEYGLYDGKQRFAADQVPMDFHKVFRRTAAKRGSKMVFGWKTLKAIEKRMVTNFIFVRARNHLSS